MRTRFLFVAFAFLTVSSNGRGADLSGSWSGHWQDCKSGHTGPLHATFCKCDEDRYRVTFSGRFFKVFPFRYQVVLTVTGREGDKVFLTGEQSIPLFGSFTYTAEATATDFTAHFCSRRYQGDFILTRCCP